MFTSLPLINRDSSIDHDFARHYRLSENCASRRRYRLHAKLSLALFLEQRMSVPLMMTNAVGSVDVETESHNNQKLNDLLKVQCRLFSAF
jgi:hypothetical protein